MKTDEAPTPFSTRGQALPMVLLTSKWTQLLNVRVEWNLLTYVRITRACPIKMDSCGRGNETISSISGEMLPGNTDKIPMTSNSMRCHMCMG